MTAAGGHGVAVAYDHRDNAAAVVVRVAATLHCLPQNPQGIPLCFLPCLPQTLKTRI